MSLKQATQLVTSNVVGANDVTKVAELSPSDWNAALVDENGDTAFSTAGLVAALSAVTASAAELNSLDLSAIEARTVTAAPGGTTGVITGTGAINLVQVTSDDATKVLTLPVGVAGKIVIAIVGANGYELRSDTPASVSIGGGSGANAESAIPANSIAVVFALSATAWVGFTITGATLAAIEAAV